MSLPGPKPFLSDGLFDSLFGATALSHDVDRAMPPVFTGDAIPTGSPAVAEKLPAWEANARVVLAGAKRWAQRRWGLL